MTSIVDIVKQVHRKDVRLVIHDIHEAFRGTNLLAEHVYAVFPVNSVELPDAQRSSRLSLVEIERQLELTDERPANVTHYLAYVKNWPAPYLVKLS